MLYKDYLEHSKKLEAMYWQEEVVKADYSIPRLAISTGTYYNLVKRHLRRCGIKLKKGERHDANRKDIFVH